MLPPRRWLKSAVWERQYPLLAAVVAGVAGWCFGMEMPVHANYALAATVTFGAIVSGFVGTSLSILIALNSPVMQKIRKTKVLVALERYLRRALTSGIVLSCTSLLGMWTAKQTWYPIIWLSVLVFCLMCLIRLARVILDLFRDPEITADE